MSVMLPTAKRLRKLLKIVAECETEARITGLPGVSRTLQRAEKAVKDALELREGLE